jgi:microcystin degradation protein MlrC
MTRIAIGGFLHESHSFAPLPTGWEQFLTPGGFPALQRAATLLEALRPTSLPSSGAIRAAEAAGADEPGGAASASSDSDDMVRARAQGARGQH